MADSGAEACLDNLHLVHRVGGRAWWDNIGGARQGKVTGPALTVDPTNDRELFDQEPVVVAPVDGVKQFPRHSVHVTGDSEQLYPSRLLPELTPDCIRHHFSP